jgi:hypothetical protein
MKLLARGLIALIVGFSGVSSAALAQPRSSETEQAVTRYVGVVDSTNAGQVLSQIQREEDHIVGLKLWFSSRSDPTHTPGYFIYPDGKPFSVAIRSDNDGTGVALDFPKTSPWWDHTFYVVDGFFLVKYAGVNTGIHSETLIPVDEAQVRLAEHVEIRDKVIGSLVH